MNFAEQPPSTQWTALKYRGARFAEVWLKPGGDCLALTIRIPQDGFQLPDMGRQLTIENLLKAVAIEPAEVDSWIHGDVSHSGLDSAHPEFRNPLMPPSSAIPYLEIHVRLKPAQSVGGAGGAESDVPEAMWQALEVRWKAIQTLEASLDTLRISMEGLMAEMEASLKRALTTEEKLHARRADLAEWSKAKTRVHHALPRVREAIHRSIWAMGTHERKHLEEVYKNQIKPRLPFPRMDKVMELLENLQKDRQVLFAHGTTVYHECKSTSASAQGTLRTLQNGAAANAKKKSGSGAQSKFFKNVRRWSGAE
ncbi:MAG: hypothetical protein FJ271_14645 [Planctomycetes bacterium]|nr:hypothetical protein [Planctomycetota bacterium]